MPELPKLIMGIVISAVIIIILLAIIRFIRFYQKEVFICPNCGYSWKPSVSKLLFSAHMPDGNVVSCPHCGSVETMEPSEDANKR